MKKVIAESVVHKGENRVALRFSYDTELIDAIKSIPGSRWSSTLKCWHIPENKDVTDLLLRTFRGKAFVNYSGIDRHEKNKNSGRISESLKNDKGDQKQLSDYKKGLSDLGQKGREDIALFRKWLEVHRYPLSTIKTYCGMLETFLKFVSPKESRECTVDDVVGFVDKYIISGGLSYSYQNQMISALKKYYGNICKTTIDPGHLGRPRRQHRLPNVLSKEEVKKMLDSVSNEKHRLMLSIIYGCGLRRSEVLNLIPSDIDRSRKLLRIRQSKGYKDRFVPLSDKLLGIIESYLLHYRPEVYLFEGQYRGTRYSEASLEKVFHMAFKKAGIDKKDITLHGLRHSYATHLLEAGTDLRYIQELLGHRSSRTTEIYTHVTTQSIQNIRSPFDDL